jgi:hypothetical protein
MSTRDISQIVGKVLGAEDEKDIDFAKGFSKYKNMREISIKYINIFNFISKSSILRNYPDMVENICEYVNILAARFKEFFSIETDHLETINNKYPIINDQETELTLKFVRAFNETKKSIMVKCILDTCNSLMTYKNSLSNMETLNDKFIIRYAGNVLHIIPETSLNLKIIYLGGDANDKKMILLTFHKLYTVTYSMYEEYSKPDMNIDNFVNAISIAIADLRKKIPRCEQAFKIIEDSSKMLEKNYPAYYKDYASSNNSMIIAENFIYDVSNSVSNKSPAIAFQFKRIISELKKMASKVQGMDAKYGDMLKVLSNTADANFNEIRKKDVEGVEGEGEDVEDVEVEDVEVEDVEGEDVEGEGVEGVEVEGVEVEGVEVEGVEGGV